MWNKIFDWLREAFGDMLIAFTAGEVRDAIQKKDGLIFHAGRAVKERIKREAQIACDRAEIFADLGKMTTSHPEEYKNIMRHYQKAEDELRENDFVRTLATIQKNEKGSRMTGLIFLGSAADDREFESKMNVLDHDWIAERVKRMRRDLGYAVDHGDQPLREAFSKTGHLFGKAARGIGSATRNAGQFASSSVDQLNEALIERQRARERKLPLWKRVARSIW